MSSLKIDRREFARLGLSGIGALALGLPASSARAADNNTLRIRLPGDIGNLDPSRVFQIENQTVASNIYSGLVRYDDATGKILPDLAERWDVSADGRVYTFQLRQGVKWHKGYGEFSADDVKFSFDRIQNPATGSSYQVQLDGMKVEVVSPRVVRISRERADPRMLHVLTAYNQGWLVSRKAVTEIGAQAYPLKPIGTGPFVFEKWSPGSEIVLSANPDYFGGKPKLDGLVFRVIKDENAAAAALTNGEIDVAFAIQAPDVIERLKKAPGIKVSDRAAAYTMNLVLNTSRPPFDNVKVRHAVGYAVNRDALITGFFHNTKTPALSVITTAFPEFTDQVPRYPFDPEKAKALLKEVGGGPIAIDLVAPASSPYDKIVVPIANDLNMVGFQAKIVVLERGAYAAARGKGTLMTAITGVAGPVNADNPLNALYAKKSFPPGLNTAQYAGAESLFEQLAAEMKEPERTKLYHAIQQKTMEDLPVLPLYTMSVYVAMRANVTGLVQNALSTLNCYVIRLG
jgi:peptide/nickel transport system substrate-binding protein